MTTPRRRIVRLDPPAPPAENPRRVQKIRDSLDRERILLNRWMSRLKRAGNAVQKHQTQAARLERRIRQLESQ